jgi:DNA-binding NtrC family response regulator
VYAQLERLAPSDLSVLIEGETGTGKEVAARALHAASRRARGPFVVLDCTAVPPALAESVLFGHEKGAFTGANERRVGVFEAATDGTVFLDEVGELPSEVQPKLLRVLERREVVPVGGTRPRPVNIRMVSATWRDLRAMINQGSFREDLYYRLAFASVRLPSLAERRDDIPALLQHFLARLPPATGGTRAVAPDALAALVARNYPGNVRELLATIERAALVADGAVITRADLAFERRLAAEASRARPEVEGDDAALAPFRAAKQTSIDEFERAYLARLVERAGSNISRAAALAGISRVSLRDLLRRHGLRDD